jgi:hypothetical protein
LAQTVLTDERKRQFELTGIVRLPAFVTAGRAARAADRVWEVLARRGVVRDDRATWPVGRLAKLQALAKAQVYADFDGEALDQLADQLLGSGRWQRVNRPTPLVSFPEPGPWELPHKMWHFDLPARGTVDRPIALRLLGLVEAVGLRGGGTLVVVGSHELTRRMVVDSGGDAGSSAEVRAALGRRLPWFRDLFSAGGERQRFFEPVEIDGVTVHVTETVGEAGDGYLMHPWSLHGLSPNVGTHIRSMLTHTVYAT